MTTLAEPLLTIVSMPDFLNGDVGDCRIRAGRGWDPGDPNSINDSYRRGIEVVLDEVEFEQPDAVLVAGDLVEGHWGVDVEKTGIFGPVGTEREKLDAVRNAGNLYYREWRLRFAARELDVYPAVGDHEIGDNPWKPNDYKYRAYEEFKDVWARNFTTNWGEGSKYPLRPVGTNWEDTAYAVKLSPEVLLVTCDCWRKQSDGVHATYTNAQLDWIQQTITKARTEGVQWVLVQAHVPVITPVRTFASSSMSLEEGTSSAFWQLLKTLNVDMYLCGEVHDMTTWSDGPLVQVAHGSITALARQNYLLLRIYADRIECELKRFTGQVEDREHELWQTSWKRPPSRFSYQRGTTVVGAMTIDKSTSTTQLLNRSGYMLDGIT